MFLKGLEAHQADPSFPSAFFTTEGFVAKVQAYSQDTQLFSASKDAWRNAQGRAMAMRSQGAAMIGQGELALQGFYGPDSETLPDFGVKPKGARRPPRRRKQVAQAPPAPPAPPGSGNPGTPGGGTPGTQSPPGSGVPTAAPVGMGSAATAPPSPPNQGTAEAGALPATASSKTG
jgi:hypothetical protein